MASRKLLMGLTTGRRLQSRTQQLFWATSLPEATTSRSLVVAAATAQLSGRLAMQEDEFHKLADETIHDLLEKLEEYGDSIQMDGFDIEYGNQVLTLRLGDLGTYVINKQTPNKQIWLSSPVRVTNAYLLAAQAARPLEVSKSLRCVARGELRFRK
ncbi:unnamed protein product [Miscanthus lutarioriparius]|uniref:Ferroxidase n=1 Tax=Miscanthus lutarioriparius TaxID=422564 RepID=A0A811PR60_9POAL|nr:unnamed protein product [Miscanthus lutarioriparius]